MKREDVSKIFEGATDEQINSILNINSADIGKAKADYESIKQELAAAKDNLSNMTGELNTLKEGSANAAEWEKKFNDLSAEMEKRENRARLEREAKEKADMVASRFNAAAGEKKFTHEAIKADYLHKFGEALENKDFAGKSDTDIFHELTKDDKAAFEGIVAMQLAGGTNKDMGEDIDEAHVRAVMGLSPLNKQKG